jgi:hypothetical protein
MTEAKKIQEALFSGLPALKRWMDNSVRASRKSKEVATAFGRVRPLSIYYNSDDRGMQSHGDRCVCNTMIQGSCSDIMKTAMVRVHNWIQSNGLQDDIRILITMHDELVFEIKENKLADYIPKLNQIMCMTDILQGMLHWDVPLKVDAEYGRTWYAENNFFDEHPELRDCEPVEFNKVVSGGRFAAAANNVTLIPEKKPEEATPADTIVTQAPDKPASDTPAPETKQEPVPLMAEEPEAPAVAEEDFVYVIKDRKKSTNRRLNDILLFLKDEESEKRKYAGAKKRIIIKDTEGNSLLVSEYKFNTDAFLALSRYLGV